MYSDDVSQKEIHAAKTIQRCYRGFIVRRLLRQKLKIDEEFRLLRQKYEVRSSSTSMGTSLAFSKTNPFK